MKSKLWKNLKLSAFVVGAAPWLIPDSKCMNKDELTDSEGKTINTSGNRSVGKSIGS